MKILLVDDDPRRHRRLIEQLGEDGIPRDDITLITHANGARDELEKHTFDLMVLDIVLPLRPEGDPDERHSIDLIREIIEFGDLKRPRQIVGLSASDAAAVAVTPFFADRLWTVIRYSNSNDEWIGQIKNCVRYMSEPHVNAAVAGGAADIVVICALADPELSAVLALPWKWQAARPIDDCTFVHEGAVIIDGSPYSIIAASAPRMGMVHTALLAEKLLRHFKPKLMAMTGICAGIRGKVNIGDVLLADPTWDWQSGKRATQDDHSKFLFGPHQLDVDSTLRSRFEQLRSNKEAFASIAAKWPGMTSIPNLVIGPVASGSAVIADSVVIEGVREQHRELCGIEMEAYGLYAAVAVARKPRPLVFSIKSVCDFADFQKGDEYRACASYLSAKTLELFLSRFGSDLLGQRMSEHLSRGDLSANGVPSAS